MYDKNHFESIAKLTLDTNSHDVDFLKAYVTNSEGAKRIKYWLSLDVWTKREAVLILLDLNPDRTQIYEQRIEGCESFSGYFTVEKEFHEIVEGGRVVGGFPIPVDEDANGNELYLTVEQEQQLDEITDLFLNYARFFRLLEKNSPTEWIETALSKGIYIPWYEWAVENGIYKGKHQAADQPTLNNKKLASLTRERESMLKIIIALAKNGYAYPNRRAFTEMLNDFQRNDNGVNEKTLRKFLKEADKL